MSTTVSAATPGGGSSEWLTPGGLYAALDRRYAFDFDAFASHDNALAPTYATADGTFKRKRSGEPERLSDLDGFEVMWSDRRVFLNPPYSRGLIDRAVAKAHEEADHARIVVGLLPAAVGSRWFQDHVFGHANLYFLPKRVRYLHPDLACGPRCPVGLPPRALGALRKALAADGLVPLKHAAREPAGAPGYDSVIAEWRPTAAGWAATL